MAALSRSCAGFPDGLDAVLGDRWAPFWRRKPTHRLGGRGCASRRWSSTRRPTAWDAGTETVILDAWRDYTKVTILVTAHRPSVLRNADQMVTVASGRVMSAITRALERS